LDTEVVLSLVLIFLLVSLFIGYGVLAIFFPEWVGIAGKKAQEIEARHNPENIDKPDETIDL
tara:strand:- start:47778 stop:47963 length:186 start_codon:yes stop_codon:yes gene_type:complete